MINEKTPPPEGADDLETAAQVVAACGYAKLADQIRALANFPPVPVHPGEEAKARAVLATPGTPTGPAWVLTDGKGAYIHPNKDSAELHRMRMYYPETWAVIRESGAAPTPTEETRP
jgi:hypothetical protein